MSLPTRSLDTIRKWSRAYFRTAFQGMPMGLRQFLGQSAQAIALNVWGGQKSVEDVDLDIVPQPQSSLGSLQNWAFLLGLPNGQGGFGAFLPTLAGGGVATLTGVGGTSYVDGFPGSPLIATGPDGTTQIRLSGSVMIPGSPPNLGSVSAKFVAVTPGSIGNLLVGDICTWVSAPSGADPTFTLTTGLSGANDSELNAGIYGRIVPRLQTPPRGGVAEDYVLWAETVAGVVAVYVYPKRSGTGTIDVVILNAGSGTGRVPGVAVQTAVAAAIKQTLIQNTVTGRPAAVEAVNVLLPFTAVSGHLVRVRVTPSVGQGFDWADGGTALVVDSGGYSAGPPATIRFTGLAPASLKAAIDAYIASTGPQPRLQVLSTGGPPMNGGVGTSKTITWSDSGGKTTVTLDSLPPGWAAPSSGDSVYAYGPAVAPIAAALLAIVDGLGPSIVSGFANPLAPWRDTITISALIAAAENALDATGNPLVSEVLAGGATIDGTAADVEGGDTTTPELLYASHIAVTA